MKKGDRIKIAAVGTDDDSPLQRGELKGTVTDFISGYEPQTLAAVVTLESPITHRNVEGAFLVLELRHHGATWDTGSQVVGVDLYAERPTRSMAGEIPPQGWTPLEVRAVFEVKGAVNDEL